MNLLKVLLVTRERLLYEFNSLIVPDKQELQVTTSKFELQAKLASKVGVQVGRIRWEGEDQEFQLVEKYFNHREELFESVVAVIRHEVHESDFGFLPRLRDGELLQTS